MPKPLGISMSLGDSGLSMRVVGPDRVTDKIWDAVEDAIAAGWTPQQLKIEVAQAWSGTLERAAKDGASELMK